MQLLELSSLYGRHYKCPICGCEFPEIRGIYFQGIHILADVDCTCCENPYYQTIPTGHAALFPVAFAKKENGKARFQEAARLWMAEPLIASVRGNKSLEHKIDIKVFQKKDKVILLNCLDDCYGHVLLKLSNSIRTLNKEYGLIVLVPESFEWLLPEGISEAWIVRASLRSLRSGVKNLNAFVQKHLKEYNEFYISSAPIHPELTKEELMRFIPHISFDLEKFSSAKPVITFLWREDRLWTNTKFSRLLHHFGISRNIQGLLKSFLLNKQMNGFKKVAAKIKKEFPEAAFYMTGLGTSCSSGELIEDKRLNNISAADEKFWCKLYSESHLVIGIHGSNMLIPTALAAGFIELLPDHKISHMTEDLLMNRSSRFSVFLGRHLPELSSESYVAKHAVEMIKGFEFLYKNSMDLTPGSSPEREG